MSRKKSGKTATPSQLTTDSRSKGGLDFSLCVSIVALCVAFWAASETREARLDTKRAQMRSEALENISEVRSSLSLFNCYGSVAGTEMKGKLELQKFLEGKEFEIRKSLAELSNFSRDALAIYENDMNQVKGRVKADVDEKVTEIRAKWPVELREKADAVCKR